jgi:zinc finger CCHC domain-containing protein 9
MTRITNFGGKRTYLEAGFEDQRVQKKTNVSETTVIQIEGGNEGHALDSTVPLHENITSSEPPKKKRKRTPKSKRTNFKDPVKLQEGNVLTEECGTAREVGMGSTAERIQKTSIKKKYNKVKKELSTFLNS